MPQAEIVSCSEKLEIAEAMSKSTNINERKRFISTCARYKAGRWLNTLVHYVLSRSYLPFSRLVAPGRSWIYDIQRFSGTRELGVVFDVGANIGQTAWGLVRYFKTSDLYSFEPVLESFTQLQENYGHRVRCFKLALGSQRKQLSISLHSDSELNSFKETRDSSTKVGQELVEVATMDDFCAAQGIEKVAVLKIDVQGWESQVLAGASQLLKKKAIHFIYVEVGFRARDIDMQDFSTFNAKMDELGFEFCGLYEPFRWGPNKLFVGFANALYALPKHLRSSGQ